MRSCEGIYDVWHETGMLGRRQCKDEAYSCRQTKRAPRYACSAAVWQLGVNDHSSVDITYEYMFLRLCICYIYLFALNVDSSCNVHKQTHMHLLQLIHSSTLTFNMSLQPGSMTTIARLAKAVALLVSRRTVIKCVWKLVFQVKPSTFRISEYEGPDIK